jgi:hypothetical protein
LHLQRADLVLEHYAVEQDGEAHVEAGYPIDLLGPVALLEVQPVDVFGVGRIHD